MCRHVQLALTVDPHMVKRNNWKPTGREMCACICNKAYSFLNMHGILAIMNGLTMVWGQWLVYQLINRTDVVQVIWVQVHGSSIDATPLVLLAG